MWALERLGEFNRAYHSAEVGWNGDAAPSLQFAQGLLFSLLAVTPFWTTVGIVLHRLTR